MFNNIISDFLDFIYPPICQLCNNRLKKEKVICNKCFDKIHFLSKNKCRICGKPVKKGTICKSCRKDKPHFDLIIGCGNYIQPLKDIIKIFKYYHRPSLKNRLARLLYSSFLSRGDIDYIKKITWVPMRRAEKRERGYNQSALIAQEFSKISGIPADNILRKTQNIPSQTTLPKEKRNKNVEGAYGVREQKLKELTETQKEGIIIIDDVFTTGATINECSKKLKESGFKKVIGAVVAISP